jgi:hypothetical protein
MENKHFHIKLRHPKYAGFVVSLVFTVIVLATCLFNSVFTSIHPKNYRMTQDNFDKIGDMRAVSCTTGTLYYSGYDYYVHGKTVAHYYYSLDDGICTIYLINNKLAGGSDSPQLTLEGLTFSANIRHGDTYMRQLLEYISTDLEWNYYSLAKYTNAYIISQYHYNVPWLILMIVLLAAGLGSTVYFYTSYHRERLSQTEETENQA